MNFHALEHLVAGAVVVVPPPTAKDRSRYAACFVLNGQKWAGLPAVSKVEFEALLAHPEVRRGYLLYNKRVTEVLYHVNSEWYAQVVLIRYEHHDSKVEL